MPKDIISKCNEETSLLELILLYFIVVPTIGSCLGVAIGISLGMFLYPQVWENHKIAFLALGCVFSAIALSVFLRRSKNLNYWSVTKNELIQGKRIINRYAFADMEKVIIGLPKECGLLLKLAMKIGHPMANLQNMCRENTIAIKFRNGSILPVCFILYKNGDEVMNELASILQDRIDAQYEYSQPEIDALKYGYNKLKIISQ